MPRQLVLSLPPACAEQFAALGLPVPAGTVTTHDPPGLPLGSGGGLAHALVAAWKAAGEGDFAAWLRQGTRVVVHAGGESRRTPAYAAEGKVFTPVPVLRWSFGQRLDQTLLDLQWPFVESALDAAPAGVVAAVCSGDVLLQGTLPEVLPQADVVCLGMWAGPETAARHGVFFCDRAAPDRLLCMAQKPRPEDLHAMAQDSVYLVDTGLWLFRERAVMDLMQSCGWQGDGFAGGTTGALDLYGGVGLGLGSRPVRPHPLWSAWSVAVVALENGAFYHFGSSRELVDTTLRLQNLRLDRRQFGPGIREHPATFIQNARVGVGLHAANHTVWIENAVVPDGWELAHSHIVTGVPENTWALRLPAGVCLDLVPVGEGSDLAIRFYGMDDPFRGPLGEAQTRWLGRAAGDWFRDRGLTLAECGIDPAADIQRTPLFPVLPAEALPGALVQWLVGDSPRAAEPLRPGVAATPIDSAQGPRERASHLAGACEPRTAAVTGRGADSAGGLSPRGDAQRPVATGRPDALINRPVTGPGDDGGGPLAARLAERSWADVYRGVRRLSAAELAAAANLGRRCRQREALRQRALERLAATPTRTVFLRTDLAAAAEAFARQGLQLPGPEVAPAPLEALHLRMFRAAVRRRRGDAGWNDDEAAAFEALRQAFLSPTELAPVLPQRRLLPDQIVWGRCPVRIDLAGGWTDTPPYCVVHGGRVVNLAVELNGQPPIQVFGRCIEEPEIVVRSIDLGQEQRLRTFDELRRYTEVGGAFSIPRAALAMAGFLPGFAVQPAGSLREALERFGGGIDLALLAAVPKGSGLGTSSILAATVLGTLSELCGLGWDRHDLTRRTLCLEQMLTTGGGWQDQAGGITPGLKLLYSAPGAPQAVQVRWLPDTVLRRHANQTVLLYYTGITRVAKAILQDVVRGMFLNASGTLQLLSRLAENADRTADAAQRQSLPGLAAVIRRSWELNCALDAGTNPPAIQAILARTDRWLDGAKLLGAGGGGYLIMVAKDPDAAARVRQVLAATPPNAAARFVDLGVSDTGLQVTRS